MGFVTKRSNDPIVTVEDIGYGMVALNVGNTCVGYFGDGGEFVLEEDVAKEEVGNLKLTDGHGDGCGGTNRRMRVFYRGEELVLPSELKKDGAKKTKRTKKSDKVIA